MKDRTRLSGPNFRWMLALGVLLLMVALVTGAAFFYYVFWCWGMMIGASLMVHRFNVTRLTLQFEIDRTEVQAGDPVKIRYRLMNNSLVPAYNVKIQPIISKAFGFTAFEADRHAFDSFEKKTIERQLICKRRGFYTLGAVRLDVSDPLEMTGVRFEKQKAIEVVVRPKIYDLEPMKLIARELMGWRGQSNRRVQDKTSIKTVRDFREGDSLKDIHWKLSAKSGVLKTKEYTQSVATTVIMLIDGERRGYEKHETLADEAMDLAASIAADLLKHRIPVKVFYSDARRTSFEGSSYTAMKTFLDQLTAFNPDGQQAFEDFIEKEARLYRNGACMMTIGRGLSEGLRVKLEFLNRLGFKVEHFALLSPEEKLAADQQKFMTLTTPSREEGLIRYGCNVSELIEAATKGQGRRGRS